MAARVLCGDIITAIAMSEPGAGSDLAGVRTTAVRDGDEYVLNGQKTFITNGEHRRPGHRRGQDATDQGAHGVSLIAVERGTPGFSRGRRLEKVGPQGQRHRRAVLRGLPGAGGEPDRHREPRLLPPDGEPAPGAASIAVGAVAGAEVILEQTLEYARTREAFGGRSGSSSTTGSCWPSWTPR